MGARFMRPDPHVSRKSIDQEPVTMVLFMAVRMVGLSRPLTFTVFIFIVSDSFGREDWDGAYVKEC